MTVKEQHHIHADRLFGEAVDLVELTPEASPRRYFRLQSEVSPPGLDEEQAKVQQWLLVLSEDAPPLATAHLLSARGVRVPLLGPCCEGAYLVEDLGDRHLWHEPSLENYNALLDGWQLFAFEPLDAEHPNADLALDETLFTRELVMFQERYLEAFRGGASEGFIAEEIARTCKELAKVAAQGPTCLQHRDFHSRNILLPKAGPLAWIDHQDLRRGPLFYDLASLYTDAYLDLPDQVYARLRAEVGPLGACFGLQLEEAQDRFHLSALQRVLKALGTFGNLLVQGRDDYAEAEERARGFAVALLDMDEQGDWRILREVVAG
ncbi:MAG: phosphotransferase [Planctomycetota bacterium]